MNSFDKHVADEIAWDVQKYIDSRIDEEIIRIACEQFDNEGISLSLEDQETIAMELYDIILGVIK